MSPQRAKWNDAEHEVLVKLHHGYTLSRQDHVTLAEMYEVHGTNAVFIALGMLRDNRALPKAAPAPKPAATRKR
jgi:hypothetical protein